MLYVLFNCVNRDSGTSNAEKFYKDTNTLFVYHLGRTTGPVPDFENSRACLDGAPMNAVTK